VLAEYALDILALGLGFGICSALEYDTPMPGFLEFHVSYTDIWNVKCAIYTWSLAFAYPVKDRR
jgi:hypothetical protein